MGLSYIGIALLALCITVALITGMEDQYCFHQRHEVTQCKAENWYSVHCYQVYRWKMADDCDASKQASQN